MIALDTHALPSGSQAMENYPQRPKERLPNIKILTVAY